MAKKKSQNYADLIASCDTGESMIEQKPST